jgi:pimeloyl-ACP methyl ester carboxylesterase
VRDLLALTSAFGYRSVVSVIGHDFGSPLAAWSSRVRPDVFRSVVMMSAPFPGLPTLPFNTADAAQADNAASPSLDPIYDDLAKLDPPPKHYQKYFATREANENMCLLMACVCSGGFCELYGQFQWPVPPDGDHADPAFLYEWSGSVLCRLRRS